MEVKNGWRRRQRRAKTDSGVPGNQSDLSLEIDRTFIESTEVKLAVNREILVVLLSYSGLRRVDVLRPLRLAGNIPVSKKEPHTYIHTYSKGLVNYQVVIGLQFL